MMIIDNNDIDLFFYNENQAFKYMQGAYRRLHNILKSLDHSYRFKNNETAEELIYEIKSHIMRGGLLSNWHFDLLKETIVIELNILNIYALTRRDYFGQKDERKQTEEEINQCWEEYSEDSLSSDILTYIPDDVETGYIPVGEVEEEHGFEFLKLNRGPVHKIEKMEVAGKITYAQLANAEANRRDSMEQNARRRANGAEGFNGRYGQ